ncbi:unnamed protein product [Malus baccata var. baccata]
MKDTNFWLGQKSVEDDASYSSISHYLLDLIEELHLTRPIVCIGLVQDRDLSFRKCVIHHVEAFNSHKKRSGVLMRRKQTILPMCIGNKLQK